MSEGSLGADIAQYKSQKCVRPSAKTFFTLLLHNLAPPDTIFAQFQYFVFWFRIAPGDGQLQRHRVRQAEHWSAVAASKGAEAGPEAGHKS